MSKLIHNGWQMEIPAKTVQEMLVDSKAVKSMSEASRLISAGAVDVLEGELLSLTVRVGKRGFVKLVLKKRMKYEKS